MLLGRGLSLIAARMRRKKASQRRALDGEETIEERVIPLQRDSQILGSHLVVAVPLTFECRPLCRECLRQPCREVHDEAIGLLDRLARFIDEATLNVGPTAPQARDFTFLEQNAAV